jgi:acetyl-CoA acyltransferase
MRNAVIVDAVRTAAGRGKQGGALSGVHPVDLLAVALRGLSDRTGVPGSDVDDVIVGCVSQVGEQAFNVARHGVLAAGFPESVPAVSIDRQCGSSLQAVQLAAASVMAGLADVVVAGGVESMSRVPMFSSMAGQDPHGPQLRARYPGGLVAQGISAELICAKWGLTREDVDTFAASSHRAAAAAQQSGAFDDEILPVEVPGPDGVPSEHRVDEGVRPGTTTESLATLKPAFEHPDFAERFPEIAWHITAGNSSSLADGASAALVTSDEHAAALGLRPRARIVSMAAVGSDPMLMLTGVMPATEQALARAGLTIGDIDAYEVNEAFAPVPIVWTRETGADPERLNVHGGAIALGHPLGATGTKLLATLLRVLEQRDGRYGLIAICEGGGMSNAMVVERLPATA